MSEAKGNKGVVVRVTGIRHCFTYLFEQATGRRPENMGKPTGYRDTFLIVPGSDNDKAIRAAISLAAKNAWGDKAAVMVAAFKDDATKFPYRDGNKPNGKGELSEVTAGFWTLTGIWKSQPKLLNEKNQYLVEAQHRAALNGGNPDAKLAPEAGGKECGKLFPGAIVTGIVEIWPQVGVNAGIRCQLQGVRHDRDAERITSGGGRVASDAEFGPPPGNPDADDDIVGGNPDNDIPF
jgi:hypothetical protein